MMNKPILVTAAIAAAFSSSVAIAEMSANLGASTNYIWRGQTQSADSAAVSGGIDWSDDSGLYAGTWVSTIANAQEVDLYVGYSMDMIDVGVIQYYYPLASHGNFTEVYANVSVENFSFGLASTVSTGEGNVGGAFDEGDMYISAGADFDAYSVWIGNYMFENDGAGAEDYIHYGVSMSKDEFTFSVDATDQDGTPGNTRIGVSYSKEWSL